MVKWSKQWYHEYKGNIRFHDYFSFMINQFPVVVVRKFDNPHSENENMDAFILVGILGFTLVITKK